jgi:hypothetical protein
VFNLKADIKKEAIMKNTILGWVFGIAAILGLPRGALLQSNQEARCQDWGV